MRKTAILMLAITIIISGLACEKKPVTLDDALALAVSSGKPVLVDFFTEW
jgi:hypothetical protein